MADPVDPEFKEAVKSYIDLHDQLTAAAKQLRDTRKQKAELANVICEYMAKHEIDGINVRDGKLVRKQSKRVEPVKKEHIFEALKQAVGEPKADDILLNIFGNRAVTNKDTLRRTRTKTAAD